MYWVTRQLRDQIKRQVSDDLQSLTCRHRRTGARLFVLWVVGPQVGHEVLNGVKEELWRQGNDSE